MSAYAHQMERELSGLSSRANSELRSQYAIDSGFYMSSFAATIFLACLLTVGLLMITLLIALSVMLQSCESSSTAIIEATRKSTKDFGYCKIYALHAELSDIGSADFPLFCRDAAVRYVRDGHYLRELNFTIRMAESYFGSVKPSYNGLDAVLIDIDDIVISDGPNSRSALRLDQDGYRGFMDEAKHQKHMLSLDLYSKLRLNGYSLVLLSRKSKNKRNTTAEQLISAGYKGWSSLIFRADEEMNLDIQEYFSRQRIETEKQGFRITGVVASRMDILWGPWLGTHIFKLPNPAFYDFEDYDVKKKRVVRR